MLDEPADEGFIVEKDSKVCLLCFNTCRKACHNRLSINFFWVMLLHWLMESHWLTHVTCLSTYYKMLLVFQSSETLLFDILWNTPVWCCKSRQVKFNCFKGIYFTVEHFCWNLWWRWLRIAQHSEAFLNFLHCLARINVVLPAFTCLVFVITTVYKIVVVMGGDSSTEGRGFQYLHHILNGHFSHSFAVKIVIFVWKDKNQHKRGQGRLFFKKCSI